MTITTKIIRSGALALALLVPMAAMAGSTEEAQSVSVSYSDLNISSPSGASVLRARVARAARKACDYDDSTRDLSVRMAQSACVAKARASADVQIAAATRAFDAGTGFALNERPIRH